MVTEYPKLLLVLLLKLMDSDTTQHCQVYCTKDSISYNRNENESVVCIKNKCADGTGPDYEYGNESIPKSNTYIKALYKNSVLEVTYCTVVVELILLEDLN